jgi:hypothetical protein
MKFILKILLLFSFAAQAQLGKEAWHWEMGDDVSLDFSTGSPVQGIAAMTTEGGCASMSDQNTGKLLFYTDGNRMWNKNNHLMPNGFALYGSLDTATTSQHVIIIPYMR